MSPSTKYRISDSVKFGNKFMRRPDLTPSKRLHIAITALYAMRTGHWGVNSNIAGQFIISRIFMLATTLRETESLIFGTTFQYTQSKMTAFRYMLSLKLEGRCSIDAISRGISTFWTFFRCIYFIFLCTLQ